MLLGIPLELTIATRFPWQLPHTASNLWINVRRKANYWERWNQKHLNICGLQTEVSKPSDAMWNLKLVQ